MVFTLLSTRFSFVLMTFLFLLCALFWNSHVIHDIFEPVTSSIWSIQTNEISTEFTTTETKSLRSIQTNEISTEFSTTETKSSSLAYTESTQKMQLLEFVHIPKTGGTAVEYAASKNGIIWGFYHWDDCPIEVAGNQTCADADWKRQYNISYLNLIHPVEESFELWHTPPSWFPSQKSPYHNKTLFAVIRNPYERFISEYYCPWMGLNPTHFIDQNASSSKMKPVTPETLNSFIMKRLSYEVKWTAHYVPQADFIYDKKGYQVVHHVLRYENLTAEFEELMQQYQYPITLDETINQGNFNNNNNNSKHMTFDDLYPETIARINSLYAKDFESFGYKMHHIQIQ